MDRIYLEIVSPEAVLLKKMVSLAELPGTLGRFEVLAGHAPLISSLGKGVIRYVSEGTESRIEIKSGMVEVVDDKVTACVETV